MNKILDKLEKDFEGEANREQIKEVVYLLFRNVNDMISNDQLPSIFIPNFGRFEMKRTKVERVVEKTGFFKDALERYKKEKVKKKKGKVNDRKNRNNDSERPDQLDQSIE